MIVRSNALRVVIGLLLIGTPLACTEDRVVPLQTLRVGLLTATDQLPHYVLVDENFGRDEGIKFEEVHLDSGLQILEALRAGSIDVGAVGVPPLVAQAQAGAVPSEVVGLMAASFVTPERPLFAVVAGPEVTTWSDLSGRPVGVNTPVSLGGLALTSRMELEGASPAALVEVSFANMGLGVRSGDLTAAVMLEPYLTQSLMRGDGRMLDWVVGGAPMERAETSVLVARTALVDDDPELLKAYLRAELAAIAWIASHESEARDVLARRLAITPAIAERIRLPLYASDGRNDPAQLQVIIDLVSTADLPGPAPESLYDETLLTDVLQER